MLILFNLNFRGAQVEVKNKKGNSPLWLAANGGHLPVVEHLFEASADIDSQDNRMVKPNSFYLITNRQQNSDHTRIWINLFAKSVVQPLRDFLFIYNDVMIYKWKNNIQNITVQF